MANNMVSGLKWFGVGAILALIIFTAGYGATLYLRHQVDQLVSECQQQVASADDEGAQSKDFQGSVVALLGRLKVSVLGKSACAPGSDPAYEDDSTPIGKSIKAIHLKSAQADHVFANTRLAALIVLSLSSLPLLWYFLLARIREIAGAVRGD